MIDCEECFSRIVGIGRAVREQPSPFFVAIVTTMLDCRLPSESLEFGVTMDLDDWEADGERQIEGCVKRIRRLSREKVPEVDKGCKVFSRFERASLSIELCFYYIRTRLNKD